MTHADAIAAFLALGAPEGDAARPTAAARDAVVDHLAHCSDCWATVAALHVDAVGEPPAGHAELAAQFGCDGVQGELWAMVALDAAAIAREHAPAARHLGWCLACRTRFAELVRVERDLARGPRWLPVGERVREAAGRLVVRIGRTVAELIEVPDGFVLGAPAAAVAVRGPTPASAPRSTRFEIGASGVWAELGVDEDGESGAALSLRVLGDAAAPLSLRVHEARDGGDVLVARYTLGGTDPVLVRGLWPGSFILELHDAHAEVHRVRLDIGPGA